MKTKKEILKMSKDELSSYKWDTDLDIQEVKPSYCSNCYNYSNCSNCYNYSNCSDCYNYYNCYNYSNCYNLVNGLYCRNLKLETKDHDKYYICNVEVTEKEFEKKKKELQGVEK